MVDQSINVSLGAHQTQIINLKKSVKGVGFVSLTQTGGDNSALLAAVHVSEPAKGFSIAVPFSDPLKAKTNQIHGAGLRLGKLHGETLTPVIAVRNVGEAETEVSATIPLGRAGNVDKIRLPRLSLEPGETKLFDTSDVRWRKIDADITAGLEIEYTGTPGSVVVSAMSVEPNGDKVFPLLMRDPQSNPSSKGDYAWFAEDEYATTVYIKNVSEKEQTFRFEITYKQGIWGSNLRKLAPHETYAFNIKQIRDAQVKGSEGNTIPLDAESGTVFWAIFDSAEKALIGRAETVDSSGGRASTYECGCPCSVNNQSTGYYDSRAVPVTEDHHEPGGTRLYKAQQQNEDCFGGGASWFDVTTSVEWTSSNPNIATINGGGGVATVTAQNQQGFTGITARWLAYRHQWNPNNEACDSYSQYVYGVESFQTDPPIPHNVRVVLDAGGFPPACLFTGVYRREVTVQIVNQFNRNVTNGAVAEAFANLDPNENTCGNGNPNPTPCGVIDITGIGQFTDIMTVSDNSCGSGISQGSGCGFTLTSTWRMCGTQSMNIWTYNGETRSNIVRVNGNGGSISSGTELFP